MSLSCIAGCGCYAPAVKSFSHMRPDTLRTGVACLIWRGGCKASPVPWEAALCRCFMSTLFGFIPPSLISSLYFPSLGLSRTTGPFSLLWFCASGLSLGLRSGAKSCLTIHSQCHHLLNYRSRYIALQSIYCSAAFRANIFIPLLFLLVTCALSPKQLKPFGCT